MNPHPDNEAPQEAAPPENMAEPFAPTAPDKAAPAQPKHAPDANAANKDSPLPVLFLDGEALVLDKPAGMPVTPTKSGDAGVEMLAHDMRFGFKRPPEAVHRLDRDTSGCLLMARNAGALKRFGAHFAERDVRKLYLGIVAGAPEAQSGSIDMPLGKASTEALGWWMQPEPQGKQARTLWRTLATRTLAVEDGDHDYSLIAFAPVTGRTHQIRAHVYFDLGLPLLNDPVYRPGRSAKPKEAQRGQRTMLHSWHLSFARPDKQDVSATAPLPRDFINMGFDGSMVDEALVAKMLNDALKEG